MADRHKRVKALVQRNIADILQFEIKKESIGMVCVSGVEVYDDLSQANVYVTFLPQGNSKRKLEELQKTEGYVRSSLAKKLDIYKVPRVKFFLDETEVNARRVEEALRREEEALSNLPVSEEDND